METLSKLLNAFSGLKVTRQGGAGNFDPKDFDTVPKPLSWDEYDVNSDVDVPLVIGQNRVWPIVSITHEFAVMYEGGAIGGLHELIFATVSGGCHKIGPNDKPERWLPTRQFSVYRILDRMVYVAADLDHIRVTMRWSDRVLDKVTIYKRKAATSDNTIKTLQSDTPTA